MCWDGMGGGDVSLLLLLFCLVLSLRRRWGFLGGVLVRGVSSWEKYLFHE